MRECAQLFPQSIFELISFEPLQAAYLNQIPCQSASMPRHNGMMFTFSALGLPLLHCCSHISQSHSLAPLSSRTCITTSFLLTDLQLRMFVPYQFPPHLDDNMIIHKKKPKPLFVSQIPTPAQTQLPAVLTLQQIQALLCWTPPLAWPCLPLHSLPPLPGLLGGDHHLQALMAHPAS